jgi:t-SNARE complex subunit (syntaxin)
MQDRFSDIAELRRNSDDDVELGTVKDDEKNEDEDQDDELKEFFEVVSEIKSGMALIKKNIKAIEESYGQSLVALNVDQKNSEDLERLIDSTNLAAADLRNKLKEMDQENKKMGNNTKGTAQYRIRTNMHGTLTRKFLDLMSEYQEVQTKYKNKYRERVERQYKIAKPDATQEEIDEALESGNTQIFQKQILDMQHHAQAKEALIYIENRHRDIIRLEQSIKQLHQLFLDMAILVEAQGELIDQIEYNVSQSVAYTKQAVKELHKANQLQKKSRKKMCCLIIIFLVIFGALIGGLLGGLKI